MMLLGSILGGFVLDLLIGDPHGWPHPVCLIGNLIAWLENGSVRRPGKTRDGFLPAAPCWS